MRSPLRPLPAIALCAYLAAAGFAAAAAPEGPPAASRDPQNSVVKVFSTVSAPDLSRPWSKQPPAEVTASGVVIEGKRILTNAHVVNYASQV